jgi:DNA polymerase
MSESTPPDPERLIAEVQRFLENQHEVYAPINKLEAPSVPSQSEPQTQPDLTVPAASDAPLDPLQMRQKLAETTTLDALRKLCSRADDLKTDLQETNLVFGSGNPEADLMIIGEAPGAKEDAQGEPFVGASGQLLTKILAAIKVRRDDIYIANILKHRPPENRNPKAEERARSLPFLERQIDIIRPKLILCLGLVSAQVLLNSKKPLKDLRGSFQPYRDVYELTVTYHPAALLRNKNLKRDTWEDIQKLRARYDKLGCTPALPPM